MVLRQASRWTHGAVEVAAVELGTNRIRVRLKCPGLDSAPCEIAFEEQSSLLVASVPVRGFLDKLPRGDGQRLGLSKRCECQATSHLAGNSLQEPTRCSPC